MIVILCIDDNHGMMFNHRRQSKDRFLIDDIIEFIRGKKIYMNDYSYKMFSEFQVNNLIVDDNFLDKVEEGEYCFVEDKSLLLYEKNIEKLIIYKWNRKYPADLYLSIPLENRWKMIDAKEFKGYSHEKITKEICVR